MAERRSKRKDRIAAEEAVLLGDYTNDGGKREAISQRAGDAIRSGDPAIARVLEAALRHRGRIERATHGFHTYPAGLHPDAARDLVGLGTGAVLDPFCGGGTTPSVCKILGRRYLAFEIDEGNAEISRQRVTGQQMPIFNLSADTANLFEDAK